VAGHSTENGCPKAVRQLANQHGNLRRHAWTLQKEAASTMSFKSKLSPVHPLLILFSSIMASLFPLPRLCFIPISRPIWYLIYFVL
jgi:hypothetical protein